MKKTELKSELPVCAYRNLEYEVTTKKELAEAQDSLQAVLNVWNGLELIPCNDIYSLILNPQKAYSEAIDMLAVVPVKAGRFQVSKQAYINTLDIPIPDSLYQSAKAARTHPFAGLKELWHIVDDKVQVVESEANALIESQNIYLSDEKQINFVQRITNMVNAMNEADPLLPGLLLSDPLIRQRLGMSFKIIDQGWPGTPKIEINPDLLRRWINGIF